MIIRKGGSENLSLHSNLDPVSRPDTEPDYHFHRESANQLDPDPDPNPDYYPDSRPDTDVTITLSRPDYRFDPNPDPVLISTLELDPELEVEFEFEFEFDIDFKFDFIPLIFTLNPSASQSSEIV